MATAMSPLILSLPRIIAAIGSSSPRTMACSGGFSPSLSAPIALAFVPPAFAALGTPLQAMVRGKPQPAVVASLPFVPHRYMRQP